MNAKLQAYTHMYNMFAAIFSGAIPFVRCVCVWYVDDVINEIVVVQGKCYQHMDSFSCVIREEEKRFSFHRTSNLFAEYRTGQMRMCRIALL